MPIWWSCVCIQTCAYVCNCCVVEKFNINFMGVDGHYVEYAKNVIVVDDKKCVRAYICDPK